ncbi:MAG TPA: hypothetical protein VGA21_04195 [Cyclobacteriaceae bacterium]|jgi:hypothetical protein
MDTSKFIKGTIVGGVAYFFLGFLIYAVLLEDFFINNAGTAIGVTKTEMEWWPLVLGNLSLAALFSYIFLKWANITSFGDGLKAAGILGFMIGLSFDMVMYDTSNIMNLTAAFVDVIAFTVMTAIGGGVIGAVLGMGAKSAS